MTEIWETLPASPCSASSGDSTGQESHRRHNRQEMLLKSNSFTKTSQGLSSVRQFPPSSPPLAKRARFGSVPPIQSLDSTVEFVEARSELPQNQDLPSSKSNVSPKDEDRRRKLMERLRDIERKKTILKSSPSEHSDSVPNTPSHVVDPEYSRDLVAEDEVTFVQERRSKTSKSRPARRRSVRSKSMNNSPNAVIDVDDDKRIYEAARDDRLVNTSYDEPVKRTSSRIRKPRVLDGASPSALVPEKSKPMPTCMSKCKRLQFCKKLINTMLRDKKALPFSAPVNELWHEQSIPRYYEVISRPMDLGTIKRNLETCLFIKAVKGDSLPFRFDVDKFANDVRLVFRNAMIYNRAGDPLHSTAQTLMEDFDRTLVEQLPVLPLFDETASKTQKSPPVTSRKTKGNKATKKSRGNRKDDDVVLPTPPSPPRAQSKSSKTTIDISNRISNPDETEHDLMSKEELRERLGYLERCRVPVIARAPLPKGAGYLTRAALLYDVEMSYEQKKKCSQYVTKVPETKLGVLIEMINKNGVNAVQGDELDMDALDNKTLRNMEAFFEHVIPGFKTVRSSTLGREFSNVSQVDEEISMVRNKLNDFSKKTKNQIEPEEEVTPTKKSKSFFESGEEQDSSDSSSGSDSDGSDSSDDSGSESD